jgi:hypothetical protein
VLHGSSISSMYQEYIYESMIYRGVFAELITIIVGPSVPIHMKVSFIYVISDPIVIYIDSLVYILSVDIIRLFGWCTCCLY